VARTAAGSGGDDYGDEDVTDCPECGAEIYAIAGRCPKCGHWFVEQDRRAMRANLRNDESTADLAKQLRIAKIGAVVLLVAAAIVLLVAGALSVVSG
jgi:predicted ATP-dependent serine protease